MVSDLKKDGNDIGNALLLGMSWHGTLDMRNPVHMERFSRYVARTPTT